MNYSNIHPFYNHFNEQIEKELIELQYNLSHQIVEKKLNYEPKIITGVDISYFEYNQKSLGACSIVTIDIDSHEILEKVDYTEEVLFPYVPGLFSFREIPLFLKTWKKLNIEPDVVIFDGQGKMHPRRLGLASHASLFINKPTIGVGKTYLKVDGISYKKPTNTQWAYEEIKINEEIIGVALITKLNSKPIFVSVGNNITLEESMDIIKKVTLKENKFPLTTLLPDQETKKIKKSYVSQSTAL